MKRAFKYPLLLATVLLSLCACSTQTQPQGRDVPLSEKTNQEVIDEYKPKLMEFKDACQAIFKLIPKSHAAAEPVLIKGLDPGPYAISYVDASSPPESNTDVIMYEELKDPDTYFSSNMDFQKAFRKDNPLNLGKGGQIDQYFYAFDQCTDKAFVVNDDPSFKNGMVPVKKPEPSDKALKLCVDVLKHGPPRYLGIIRVSQYKEPKLVETSDSPGKALGYVAGILNYDFFFVDVPSKRILGSVSGSVKNASQVSVEVQKSWDEDREKRDALESELATQLRDRAKSDIYAGVEKLTGVDLEQTK